ncbi:MAG: hypothetical protein AB7V50_06140 [Vampirovibrionia bacterium]
MKKFNNLLLVVLLFSCFVYCAFLRTNAEVFSPSNNSAKTNLNDASSSVKRYSKNPMLYEYVSQYGDYIKDLDPPFKDTIAGKNWYTHFLTFPITYYISPCNKNEKELILKALAQYKLYFPMQEVTSPTKAALTIEVVEKQKLLELCDAQKKPTILGCGGPMYETSQVGANKGRAYRGFLYVKKNMFYVPGAVITVLHELAHSFGVKGHSKNPKDVMYYQLDTWALASNNSNAKNIPKHLTYRDLNTLYMIYNDWYDKK